MRSHYHRPREEGCEPQSPDQQCKYSLIELHVFGVERSCMGAVGDDCTTLCSFLWSSIVHDPPPRGWGRYHYKKQGISLNSPVFF